MGGTWAGIWGAGMCALRGKGQEGTYCVLEVRGHAHAQLHLLHGQIELLTHLLPQGQQHLQRTRGQDRDFPDFLTTQRRLNPHLDQGLQDSNCCPAKILAAASEEGWEKYPAERSLTPALTVVLRALHYPAQGVPTSLQPDSDWFDWDRQTVTGNQPTVTFSPRKSYLEVRIWPLTEVMPDAANGHQPHKFQAGALVDDMLHGSRGV